MIKLLLFIIIIILLLLLRDSNHYNIMNHNVINII